MRYDLQVPGSIRFGNGRRRELAEAVSPLGKRVFAVQGSRTLVARGVFGESLDLCKQAGIDWVELTQVTREPTVADVDAAVRLLHEQGAGPGDVIVGIGGGAALDLAKAIAALAPQAVSDSGEPYSVRDYLEGVGIGRQLIANPLPFVAVPTTAGTGSEATKNSVISQHEPPFKKSLRDERMLARAVIVDPQLLPTTQCAAIAHSGMDAITQLLESAISRRQKPVTLALAAEGLWGSLAALRAYWHDPTCVWARERMAHAALLSGICLANSGLGMAHGVAAALGVHAQVPHGLACAVMLPIALETNLSECSDLLTTLCRQWDDPGTDRTAEEGIEQLREINRELGIPCRLRDLGVTQDQTATLAPASRGNSMDGNPVTLSDEQLCSILEKNW